MGLETKSFGEECTAVDVLADERVAAERRLHLEHELPPTYEDSAPRSFMA